jgi:pimeloyl-ACP methyl ester carboxylesterase
MHSSPPLRIIVRLVIAALFVSLCPFVTAVAGEPGDSPQPTVAKIALEGAELTLTQPARPAPGKPWLWVGEFAGHLKSLESALVARGWHVAYVNVRNRFGSPKSMAVWEMAYAELHGKRGLSARPALLGISRGGLYVNAWARLHPDRLSVLYLDNGVCDIRSWPGGWQLAEKGNGSKGDWDRYKTEFGFPSDDEALEKSVRPTDGLLPAIKNGVFLISVHGTADRTVPYVDNAKPLVELWEKSNGRLQIFPKEGGDHHPHGLPDPAPLIELLCKEAAVAR